MEIISRIIPAKPRNKELYFEKSSGGSSLSGAISSSGSGISTPSYWELITTDAEGNPLEQPYIKTTYPAVSEKEISAYGLGSLGSSSGVFSISDAVDVSLSGLTADHLLKYNGTHWVNIPMSSITPNLTGYATEVYVNNKITDLIGSSPSTLDTLNELAAALGNDPNFATTLTNQIAAKQDKLTAGTNITISNNVISAAASANNYLSSVTGSGNGTVTFNRTGLTALTVDLTHTHTFASLTSKPTTISGFGITDAYTKTQIYTKTEADGKYATITNLTSHTGDAVAHLTNTEHTQLTQLLSWFKLDANGNVYTEKNFYSTLEVSAYGVGSGSGGTGSYNRLDSWIEYDSSKSGWVLSALLGYDLHSRVNLLEGGSATTVNTTGTGNAITAINKAGTAITATKGLTFSLDGHTHDYLPLTGGTLTGALTANAGIILPEGVQIKTSSNIEVFRVDAARVIIGVNSVYERKVIISGNPVTIQQGFNEYTVYHSGNLLAATQTTAGLLSSADKAKLDGIAAGAKTGTVTSVAMTVPTGLSVSGSPITTSGTLAVSLASGYSIPTTAKQTQWDTAYTHSQASHAYLPLTGGTLTGNLTAPTFIGALTGNADTATTATNLNRSILAGNGLSGGGVMTADRTITLGTPSSITATSTNSVTATSHTHNLVMGSGSGLDADLLDGLHKTAFSQEFHYGVQSVASGYYKINILPATSWMLSFTIRVYQNYQSFDITISGYNYGANYWHSPKAILSNSSVDSIDVKFGYDSAWNLWVAIPASNYIGLTICNINNGYTQVNDWSNKFTITNEATLTGTVEYTITAKRSLIYDENSVSASKLQTARAINGTNFDGTAAITTANWGTARILSYTGDVTGSASVNGSTNVATAMTLANSGVTAGTYRSVTVDAKGRVTAGTNPTTVSGYGLTDAVTINTAQTITAQKTFNDGDAVYGLAARPSIIVGDGGTTKAGAIRLNGNVADAYALIQATTTALHIDMSSSSGNIYLGNYSTGHIGLINNVGIGKIGTGSYKLDVEGTGRFSGSLNLYDGLNVNVSTAGDGGWSKGIIVNSTSATSGEATIAFTNISTGTNYWIAGINQSTSFDIAYGTTFSNAVTKLRIDINGKVGLGGNMSPTEILDVTGNIKSSGTVNATNFVSTATSGYMLTGAKATWANGIQASAVGGGLAFVTNGGTLAQANTQLYLDPNGNTRIGKSSTVLPTEALHVVGNILTTGALETSRLGQYGTYNSAQTQGIWSMGNAYNVAASTTTLGTQYGLAYSYISVGGSSVASKHQIHFAFNGAAKVSVNLNDGNITASGEVTAFVASDLRLKENIKLINNSLDLIDKLNPVSYNWNSLAKELNPNKSDDTDYGLIAQEVEEVLPNVVHGIFDNKYKSIDYIKLVPILISAVKELREEINKLK